MEHEFWMGLALQEAMSAFAEDEVPIGCVIVSAQGKLIAKGYNQTERLQDPTAHAEMIAITAACEYLGAKYLSNCTLYVTLEPCLMCSGAIRWAQVDTIVFGASDTKYGFMNENKHLFPKKTQFIGGVLEEPCRALLQDFFKNKR